VALGLNGRRAPGTMASSWGATRAATEGGAEEINGVSTAKLTLREITEGSWEAQLKVRGVGTMASS